MNKNPPLMAATSEGMESITEARLKPRIRAVSIISQPRRKRKGNFFMFAAAYARYSTANQQETSIAAQLDGIQAYCDREGITLIGMPYIDEAKSGTNMDRPGFQRLLADAQKGKFEAVVVYDISRGSRDVGDWFMFRKQMSDLGIKVLSATNTLGDMDDPNAFLQELLSVGLGQHMVLQSRQKSIAGKRIRAERGLHCGGIAPLGYDIVDGKYVINPREAAVVRMIFERYAAGDTYADIISRIEQTGVRGKNGRRIEANTLHFILKNERYTGKYIWFDREERHMHKHVGRDNENKIIIENAIPRIVPQDIWEIVRLRMDHNKRMGYGAGRKDGHTYLLSGLVRCGECGSACSGVTTVSKGREYPRYICLGKRNEKRCACKNVKSDVLDKYIAQRTRELFIDDDAIRDAAEKFRARLLAESNIADQLRAELAALESRHSRLVDLILDSGLTPELKKRMQQDEQQRKDLQARLDKCAAPDVLDLEDIITVMRADADRYADDARAMILRYVHSVTIYSDRVEVKYTPNFATKNEKHPSNDGCKPFGSPGADRVLLTITIPREMIA